MAPQPPAGGPNLNAALRSPVLTALALPAGLMPVHVARSPSARWLVATDRKSADLHVYDLEQPRIEARDGIGVLRLGAAPFDLTIDRAGSLAYVCLVGGDRVVVVDLAALR